MNVLLKLIVVMITFLGTTSTGFCAGISIECKEEIIFSFDGRPWELGFENNGNVELKEYTLKGESVDDWSELVTTQKMEPIEASPQQYYSFFISSLKNTVGPTEVHSKIISNHDNRMIFEWWIDADSPYAQHEWFEFFKNPHSLLILRYTTKKLDQVEKVRPVWEKILKSAYYKSYGDCEK